MVVFDLLIATPILWIVLRGMHRRRWSARGRKNRSLRRLTIRWPHGA
jgi:hypothetical protein